MIRSVIDVVKLHDVRMVDEFHDDRFALKGEFKAFGLLIGSVQRIESRVEEGFWDDFNGGHLPRF